MAQIQVEIQVEFNEKRKTMCVRRNIAPLEIQRGGEDVAGLFAPVLDYLYLKVNTLGRWGGGAGLHTCSRSLVRRRGLDGPGAWG